MEGTSWTMSNNYFTSPSGKVVTQWPYGNYRYRFMTKALGRCRRPPADGPALTPVS